MNPTLSSDQFNTLFGYLPWAVGIAIVLVAYFALRNQGKHQGIPIKQTFACANCGRRGSREHMIPVTGSGVVTWYCSHCK